MRIRTRYGIKKAAICFFLPKKTINFVFRFLFTQRHLLGALGSSMRYRCLSFVPLSRLQFPFSKLVLYSMGRLGLVNATSQVISCVGRVCAFCACSLTVFSPLDVICVV